MKRWAGLIMLAALLAVTEGHAFTAEALKQVDRRVAFYDLAKDPTAFVGKNVILGGTIMMVSKRDKGTRLEIAELPLTAADRPDPDHESIGRFMASSPEGVDRRVYRPGSLITVIGTVRGMAKVTVEDEEELYPLVAVKEMRIWSDEGPAADPEDDDGEAETTYVYEYPAPAYSPYWYPYYPWWFGWGIYIGDYPSHRHYPGYYGRRDHAPPRGYSPPPARPRTGGSPPVRRR